MGARVAIVAEYPACVFCRQRPAQVDGKTKQGVRAYMCAGCFELQGIGLGLGKGQLLVMVDGEAGDE